MLVVVFDTNKKIDISYKSSGCFVYLIEAILKNMIFLLFFESIN